MRRALGSVLVLAVALALAAAPVAAQQSGQVKMVTKANGLKYSDLVVGKGEEAKPGMLVMVNYNAWLADGTKFDSSYDRREPFSFKLGAGEVIQGWDEGVVGMKIGGKRKLVIPPDLAYGEQGAPGRIPPNATLTFEVELLKAMMP